jgi:hypothetical protein
VHAEAVEGDQQGDGGPHRHLSANLTIPPVRVTTVLKAAVNLRGPMWHAYCLAASSVLMSCRTTGMRRHRDRVCSIRVTRQVVLTSPPPVIVVTPGVARPHTPSVCDHRRTIDSRRA